MSDQDSDYGVDIGADDYSIDSGADQPNIRCAEISFVVNILIDRGIISDSFLHFYYKQSNHNWCPHCVNAKLRALYYVDTDLYMFTANCSHELYSFPMSSARLMSLLKYQRADGAYNFADVQYLARYIQLDDELAHKLLFGGQYHPLMREFVTDDEIETQMMKRAVNYGINCGGGSFPDLFNSNVLGQLITEWHRIISAAETDAVTAVADAVAAANARNNIARNYSYFYYLGGGSFPVAAVELYHDDLLRMSPIIILVSYVTAHEINSYPADGIVLMDHIMSFSDIDMYTCMVMHYINILISQYHFVGINDIARLIVERHPRYLSSIIEKSKDASSVSFRPPISLPEYDIVALIFGTIAHGHDYMILNHLPQQYYDLVSIADVNKYIHVMANISYEELGIDIIFTINDIIQINCGIEFGDITEAHIKKYKHDMICNGFVYINIVPINKCSYEHIINLIRRNPNIINLLSGKHINTVLRMLYDDFWDTIRATSMIMRQYGMPHDIEDLIKMFYIKPAATNYDIVQMISVTCANNIAPA
jgi:hypothetical protein